MRVAPSVLVVAGLVWDALDPANYWGDPMLAAAVVISGALFSLPATLAIGAAILVGIVIVTVDSGFAASGAGGLEVANTLFAVAIGVAVNRVVARHGRRLAVVRSVAEAAQHAVLPAPPARIGPLAVAARYQAAQHEALIGGDAYAVEQGPNGPRVLIADVRGKGLGAVSAVAVLLGAFREAAEQADNLTELADRLDHSLARALATEAGAEYRLEGFVTALLGEFTPTADRIHLLSCGHPPAYLCTGTRVEALAATDPGLPLGVGLPGLPRAAPDSWPFAAGDSLLLVTDGITEARDPAGSFYDPLTRLRGRGPFARPQDLIDTLTADVHRFTGGPRDDDTAVLALTRSVEVTTDRA
ncbi:PP2C family protein-serine/threonine phosphatase [Kitasatospora viridis]